MPERLNQIQGIRALAMLGIFFAHTTMWLPDTLHAYVPLILKLGRSGVAAFFILSGFLLSYKQTEVPKLNFWKAVKAAWKKVSKMYVLYILTIVVCLIFNLPPSAHDWLIQSIFLIFHITLTQDFIPFAALINAFNAPAWFLSALFGIWILLYMFPNAVNAMLRFSPGKCVVAIIALFAIQVVWLICVRYGISAILPQRYLAWCHDWLVYNNPILCLSEYCVGVLVGRFCVQRQYSVTVQNILSAVAVLVSLLYVINYFTIRIDTSMSDMVIAECLVTLGLIAIMSSDSIGYKIMSIRSIVWFGNVSGYFFIIHTAVLFSMKTIYTYVPKPWLILLSLVMCVLLSALADYLYRCKNILKTNENI